MCLYLNPRQFSSTNRKHRTKKVLVYKFYQVDTRLFHKLKSKTDVALGYAPFQGTVVNLSKGVNIPSNRRKTELTPYEKNNKRIEVGLHAFTDLADAEAKASNNAVQQYNNAISTVVVECEGDPQHFVSAGQWDSSQKNVVYTKLKVKRLVSAFDSKGVKHVLGVHDKLVKAK